MATAATQPHHAPPPQDRASSSPSPIWPNNYAIPIIWAYGEPGSGKTLFGLEVNPDARRMPHEAGDAPPTTLVWDMEGSSEPYENMYHFERRDLLAELPDRYSPCDLFVAWRKQLNAVPVGKYRVGVLDPSILIEDGAVEYVKKNPTEFGLSAGQIAKAAPLAFGAAKRLWQQIIASEIRKRFECFVFTSHMKTEWRGNTATTNRIPEGKDIVLKLSSLALRLERKPGAGKKIAPQKPSATLLEGTKQRLVWRAPDGSVHPVLPPRLPEATPQAIAAYLVTPADYTNLKADERAVELGMTDDDRMLLQLEISRNQADAAQAAAAFGGSSGIAAKVAAAAAARADAMAAGVASQATAEAGPEAEPVASGTEAEAEPTAQASPSAAQKPTGEQVAALVGLAKQCFSDRWQAALAAKAGSMGLAGPQEMDAAQVAATIDELRRRVVQSQPQQQQQEPLPLGVPASAPEATGTVAVAAQASDAQRARIIELAKAASIVPQKLGEILREASGGRAARAGELLGHEADEVIRVLEAKAVPFDSNAAGATASASPQDATAGLSDAPGSITQTQRERINSLIVSTGWPVESRDAWLKKHQVNSPRNLSQQLAHKLIVELERVDGSVATVGEGVAKN